MNEVEAMTRAGETVGKAVGTGLRAARRGAVRAGHAGAGKAAEFAALAEEKLAAHGVAPEQLQQALTDTTGELVKTTRRTRKRLAKQTKRSRKDLAKQANQVRKQARRVGSDLRAALDQTPKQRRRWPWIVGLLLAGAGTAAYVVLSRRPKEIRLEDVPEEDGDQVVIPEPSSNGTRTRSNGRVTS